jgi:protein-L-isoaspartate(D-aspartate) O-methyltransferase
MRALCNAIWALCLLSALACTPSQDGTRSAPPPALATDTAQPSAEAAATTTAVATASTVESATAVATATGVVAPTADARYAAQRERLIEDTIVDRGVADPAVLAAMRAVPRHLFVPDEYLNQAYADHPVPIGYGQTISQPYIVALMTELLELEPDDRVLEIGTGSGYQAAVLAEIVDEVYTIEIVPQLAEAAQERLAELGYDNVVAKQGDGYFGWEAHAPYDAIIVTAAPDHLPQPLVGQLEQGGYIVIPIGPRGGFQSLWRFTRTGDELEAENLGGVRFVPLTGPGAEGSNP